MWFHRKYWVISTRTVSPKSPRGPTASAFFLLISDFYKIDTPNYPTGIDPSATIQQYTALRLFHWSQYTMFTIVAYHNWKIFCDTPNKVMGNFLNSTYKFDQLLYFLETFFVTLCRKINDPVNADLPKSSRKFQKGSVLEYWTNDD